MQSTAKPPQSTSALRCRVCGAVVFVKREPGVVRVTSEHEDSCDFLRAIETGRARLYTEQNGYPIEAVTLDPVGAA